MGCPRRVSVVGAAQRAAGRATVETSKRFFRQVLESANGQVQRKKEPKYRTCPSPKCRQKGNRGGSWNVASGLKQIVDPWWNVWWLLMIARGVPDGLRPELQPTSLPRFIAVQSRDVRTAALVFAPSAALRFPGVCFSKPRCVRSSW